MAKIFPNKYPGRCAEEDCKKHVKTGDGFVEPVEQDEKTVWRTWCAEHAPQPEKLRSMSSGSAEFAPTQRTLFPNKFKKVCAEKTCGLLVEPGAGFIERIGDGDEVRWVTWCEQHVPRGGADDDASDEEKAFRQEIFQHPTDDTPRRIYADWLEDQGNPRGSLIRVQCELAGFDFYRDFFVPETRARMETLWAEEKKLLDEYEDEWSHELPGCVHERRYARGFVEGISVRTDMFLDFADDLFKAAPLRFVKFTHFREQIERLAESEHLRRIPLLSLKAGTDPMGGARTQTFFSSEHLENVVALDMSQNSIGSAGVEAMIASKHLSSLKVLGLENCGLRSQDLTLLSRWPGLQQIEELYLRKNSITDMGLNDLVTSKYAENLRRLDVSFNELDDGACWTLADTKNLPKLRHLNIGHNQHIGSQLVGLIEGEYLKNLTSLHVRDCRPSKEAGAAVQTHFSEALERGRWSEEWAKHTAGLFCSQRFQPRPWHTGVPLGVPNS